MMGGGKGVCEWCGQAREGNAGDYYHEKACHARDVEKRIARAITFGKDESSEGMKRLRRELERARYVGD
jgi:hypothetical protein